MKSSLSSLERQTSRRGTSSHVKESDIDELTDLLMSSLKKNQVFFGK